MNKISLSCVALLCALSACNSPPPLSNGSAATSQGRISLGQTPRRFSIAATDAPAAVNEFSRQADLQVLFDYQQLQGRKTHAVNGELEPLYALSDMLKDSGLVFQWVDERTLAIRPTR